MGAAGVSAGDLQGQVFEGGTEAVIVSVYVTDDGRPLPGLRKDDFEILDAGVPQALTDLTADALPIDLTLLVQLSESGRQFDRVRAALEKAVGSLGPADTCRTLGVGDLAVVGSGWLGAAPCSLRGGQLAQPAGVDPDPIRPSQNGLLYEAVGLALAARPLAHRRHLGLLVTDAYEDGHSFLESKALIDAARYSDLVLNVVLAEDPGIDAHLRVFERQSSVPETLETLTRSTGGQFIVRKGPTDDLAGPAVTALETFKSSYVLAFTPTDRSRLGWHELKVNVKAPGAKHVVVSARSGYMEILPSHGR